MYNKKVLSKIDLGKFTKSDPYKDDIIYDPMGQWKYPGQNTRIPSGNITMKGVNKPLLGVASTGEKKMMQPGQEYNFPGADYVDEFPQAKEGLIVDLTPAQIEEYKKGGYIVEELDDYAAGGEPCPEGQIFNPEIGECVPKWTAPNYEVNYNDGSHYSPVSKTISLNPDQLEQAGVENIKPIMEHEKFHHWQELQDRSRMSNSGIPLRMPSPVDNQEHEGPHYHNRRELEEEQKRKEILNSIGNPDFKFIPKDVVNDRLYYGSGKNTEDPTLLDAGSNELMYQDPTTLEGEARVYENDIRGGMPSMFGEFPKHKYGGLHKFVGGGEPCPKCPDGTVPARTEAGDCPCSNATPYRDVTGKPLKVLPKSGTIYVTNLNDPKILEYKRRQELYDMSKKQYSKVLKSKDEVMRYTQEKIKEHQDLLKQPGLTQKEKAALISVINSDNIWLANYKKEQTLTYDNWLKSAPKLNKNNIKDFAQYNTYDQKNIYNKGVKQYKIYPEYTTSAGETSDRALLYSKPSLTYVFADPKKYTWNEPIKKVEIPPIVEEKPIEEEFIPMPVKVPELIDIPTGAIIGQSEQLLAPEYSPNYPKNKLGYDKYNWNSGKQVGMGTKWTLPRRNKDSGGFDWKMSKKVEDIHKYMEGYYDDDGNYIPGEIEKAEQEGRKINFEGHSSIKDKKAQEIYNKEYDEYENLKKWQNGMLYLNKKEYGGALNKFIGGGPTDCGEGMVWDEALQDCVKDTVQDVGTVRTTQYSPYEVAYDQMHPREREITQKKAEYLAKHKNLNKKFGVDQDNFPEKVLRNIINKVDYERNNYVIDQYAKKHGFNPNKHVDLVENIAEKGRGSYDMAQNSKYGSKLAPSLWSRTLSGVQELGNAAVKLLPGTQGDVFKYKVPGLSKKEAKEKAKSSTGALDAFAILDLPGQAIANNVLEYGKTVTGGTGADYKTKDIPNLVSGESMPGVTDAVSAIFNPFTYTGLASVPNLLGKGIVGAGKGVVAIKNIIAGAKTADNVLPLIGQVDNVAPLLTKVDDVSPLTKVDDARSIQMANKKVPAIIKKADEVVPKKPQGVQQEFPFPTETPLPKVEVPKPLIDNVPITKVDDVIDDIPVDDIVNVEKNTARAENEIKIMEGMDNVASANKPVVPVEVPTPIPSTIAAPKPLPNKVGNPDFFKQVLDQSPNLSASNRKFYEDVINTVKKQDNLASDAQMQLLERIRTGNHNYSGRFGNINSGISPELVTGLTGETNPLFAGIANTYSNWVVDPLGGIFNKALTKASPLNAIPQYGNKVAGNVVDIGDILATGVKEGKLVVPKGIGKRGVQGVKKLFGKTDDVADPLLIKKDKTSGGLYKAGLEPSAVGTDIKIAADAEKQGLIGRKFGKSNKEFKVTNKKDTPLSEIPLEDPGLTIYRRLPFSNKYIVVDKAKLAAGKAQWATTGGSAQKFGEAYGKGLIITGATGAVLWADAPSEEEVKEAKNKVKEIEKGNEKILSDTYDQNKKVQFKEKTVTTLADGINKGVPLEQVINDLMSREKDPVSAEMLIEIFVDNGYSKEEAEGIVNSRIRENAGYKKGGIVLDIDKNKINHWIEQGYHVEEVDDDE